jgi:hypothetical protein
MEAIKTYSNLTDSEIKRDLAEKKRIIDWLVENNIDGINEVGAIIASYYDEPEELMKKVRNG